MSEVGRHRDSKELRKHNRLWIAAIAGVIALGTVAGISIFKADMLNSRHSDEIITTNPRNITSRTELLDGTWQYMPGTSKEADGLHILPADFRIVNQDGSGGQPNPAVNNLGTQLQVDGDFAVEANMTDIGSEASLILHGTPPIISDEFRQDSNTLRLSIAGNRLTAQAWEDRSIKSHSGSQAKIAAASEHRLVVERHSEQINVFVDGKQAMTLYNGNIFDTGRVIFGADAGQDSANNGWTLSSLTATPLPGGKVTVIDASTVYAPEIKDNLQTLASQKRLGFVVGSAMAAGPMTDAQYLSQIRNFGGMTYENAFKWQFTEPQPGMFTSQEAEGMFKVAERNGIQTIIGHAPVFSEALPAWVQGMPTDTPAQRAKVKQVMVNHITYLATQFKNRITNYDIPNEIWDDDGQLRDNVFLRAMGADYVRVAVEALHQADPAAQVWFNMYGAETRNLTHAKTPDDIGNIQDAMYNFIKDFQQRGGKVYGVGLQAHVYEEGDQIDKADLKAAIARFAGTGLKVRISENDVTASIGPQSQANQYRDIFAACFESEACEAYSVWGFADEYNYWKDYDGTIRQGQDLLFNKDMRPTLAYAAIRGYLQSYRPR